MTLYDQILGLLGGGQTAAIPQGGGNMLTHALQPQNAGNMLANLPFLNKDRDALSTMPNEQLAPGIPNSPIGGFQGDAKQFYQPAGGASGSWDAPAPQSAPMQLAEIAVAPQAPRQAAPSQPPAQQALSPLPAPRSVQPIPEPREAPSAMDTTHKSLSGPNQTSGSVGSAGSSGPAKSPSFLGGLFDNLVKPGFQDRLADMYAGFASGKDLNSSISNAGLMIADGQRDRRDRVDVNLTREAAVNAGLDPRIAAGMNGRSLAEFVINQQQAKLKASVPNWQTREVNGQLVRYNENDPTGAAQIVPGVPSKAGWQALTSIEDRRAAGIPDEDKRPYQRDATGKLDAVGGAGVNVNIGDSESGKLPSNTRWIDPNDKSKGVEPIPGGPGTQMPADLAARVGVGDSFLEQAPSIRRRLAAGELTGPYDRFMGGNVSASPQAEIGRQMKSGTDVLMRFLTGAGMNETEAQAYAARYEVGYGDTAESAVSKFDQLEREIRAARERATQGRDDPRRRVPGAPAASSAAPGRTSNGISWSVR